MDKGSVVTGIITGIQEYGVFVKVDEYDGLIHISELSDKYVKDIRDYLTIGDTVDLKILEIDDQTKRLKLSYKAIKIRKINRAYQLGFSSLDKKIDKWIRIKLKEMVNRDINEG